MSEYVKKSDVIERLVELFQLQASTAKAIVEAIPAVNVVEVDEGIRMGVELAAMHGSDATSEELSRAFFDGCEQGYKKALSEQKCGKWEKVNVEDGDGFFCVFEHKECGCQMAYQPFFCPRCGAKMEIDDGLH